MVAAEQPEDDKDGPWAQVAVALLGMWRSFRDDWTEQAGADPEAFFGRLSQVLGVAAGWLNSLPLGEIRPPPGFMEEAEALWAALESETGVGNAAPLREDPRFADPLWREQKLFAFLHQTYLLFCEQLSRAAEAVDGLDARTKARMQVALRLLEETLSPANFPLTNPLVIARAKETQGASLINGFIHLFADLRRGQLTHSDPQTLRLGEDIAATPGKVIFETPMFQLIQYTPATSRVLRIPLLIFPGWINRYYLFDLDPGASFVRWTVSQGITTFIVSWKSADETMRDLSWDDYISAQLEAVEHVRARLGVPSLHALGQGLGGTTLAAALAILAARGETDRVKSATYLSAALDFSDAGDFRLFVDDATIAGIGQLSPQGYLDGRYIAAAANLMRPGERIWDHAVRHYLLGEECPASPLWHWRDDVAEVPAKWLQAHLRDLCRDNRLVEPGALTALGTPIDLTRIKTPSYALENTETPSQDPQWLEWLRAHDPAEVAVRGRRRPGGKGDRAIGETPGRYVQRR